LLSSRRTLWAIVLVFSEEKASPIFQARNICLFCWPGSIYGPESAAHFYVNPSQTSFINPWIQKGPVWAPMGQDYGPIWKQESLGRLGPDYRNGSGWIVQKNYFPVTYMNSHWLECFKILFCGEGGEGNCLFTSSNAEKNFQSGAFCKPRVSGKIIFSFPEWTKHLGKENTSPKKIFKIEGGKGLGNFGRPQKRKKNGAELTVWNKVWAGPKLFLWGRFHCPCSYGVLKARDILKNHVRKILSRGGQGRCVTPNVIKEKRVKWPPIGFREE